MLLDPLGKGVRERKGGREGDEEGGEERRERGSKSERGRQRETGRKRGSSAKGLSKLLLSAHLLPTLTSNGDHVVSSTANLHGLVVQHSRH